MELVLNSKDIQVQGSLSASSSSALTTENDAEGIEGQWSPMEYDNEANDCNKKMKLSPAKSFTIEPSDENSGEHMSKAFKNSVVLTLILKHLSSKELLKTCRMVSSEFNRLATGILHKRTDIEVSFERVLSVQKFVLTKLKTVTLKDLIKRFQNKSKVESFPCTNFGFKGNLSCPDAQFFLSEFGSIIKGLKLEGNTDFKTIQKLFTSQLSNLQHLQLKSFQKIIASNGINSDQELFPTTEQTTTKLSSLVSLELLDALSCDSTIKEIVEISPNLKVCTGNWTIELFESLFCRTSTLKTLELIPEITDEGELDRIGVRNYNTFKLNSLAVDYYFLNHWSNLNNSRFIDGYTRLNKITCKLLASSVETLREVSITLPSFCWFQVESDCPELKRVNKLSIVLDLLHVNYCSFQFSSKFPNLHSLVLVDKDDAGYKCNVQNDECPGLEFPFIDQAPSVKSLSITGRFMDMEEFMYTFPNLQHLSLHQVKDFPQLAKTLWKMTGLKSLEIELQTTFFNTSTDVNSAFTGFDKGTCEFFVASGKNINLEKSELEKLRVNPSILDLKDLEKLHLVNGYCKSFNESYDEEEYDENYLKNNGISPIVYKFALSLMPNLCTLEKEFATQSIDDDE